MAKQFGIPVKYKNKLDLVTKVIDLHLTIKPPTESLTEKAKQALAYYILHDYTKDSREDLKTAFGHTIKDGYIRVIGNMLRKNGYLIKDDKNKQKSYLSDEMKRYRQQFVLNGGKTFTIGFVD